MKVDLFVINQEPEVEQVTVPSAYYGKKDPRNGYNRSDTKYRVTLIGGRPVACTCYGFHYHGHCKHLATVFSSRIV